MTSFRLASSLALVFGLSLLACTESTERAPDGGVSDASQLDADMGTRDAGALAAPPPRPTTPDGMEDNALTFALRDVVLDPSLLGDDGWERFSLDLDGQRTVSLETPTCAQNPIGRDGTLGEDNVALHSFFPAYESQVDGDLQGGARLAMGRGVNIPLVHVGGWNGDDNDPAIRVSIANVGEARNITDGLEANWDGLDTFFPRPEFFVDEDIARPRLQDDDAYVAGRVLVASFPEFTFHLPVPPRMPDPHEDPIPNPPMPVTLHDVVLVGEISTDRAALRNVVLAGRWSVADIGPALQTSGLCEGDRARMILDQLATMLGDIRTDPAGDGADPLLACDALSVGLGFRGYAGSLGGETRDRLAGDPPSPCE